MFNNSHSTRVSLLGLFAVTVLLSGCLTGDNYPAERARTYCASLFACVAEAEIEFWTAYDDANECVDDEIDSYEDSSAYGSFQAGECDFDPDSAKRCLEEASSVTSDPDCDGTMGFLSFALDIADDDCDEVYCD
jgi:hypothetical protein